MTSQTPALSAHQALFAAPEEDDLSTHLHRQLVGYVAVALPLLLLFIVWVRPTKELEPLRILDSVSAYYYTGAVAAFVGSLLALAAFLITYRGYDNKHNGRDRVTAFIASVAAVLVAFFPTTAPIESLTPSWWTTQMRTIHYISAVVLFGALIFFSLVLFPRSNGKPMSTGKQWRNRFYKVCGWGMVACMVWAAIAGVMSKSIFLSESTALILFGVSWLVKGRAGWTLVAAGNRYGRHPRQLVGDLWNAVRS